MTKLLALYINFLGDKYCGMKREMMFEVNVNLAESYLHGVAKGMNGNYAINIQGGRTGIALPQELLGPDPNMYAEALLNFRTNSGIVSLRSEIEVGKDMIEIFDDRLLEKLALEEPYAIEILLLEDSEVLR
jgi:hypothetical protein